MGGGDGGDACSGEMVMVEGDTVMGVEVGIDRGVLVVIKLVIGVLVVVRW